ncbi:hypothetical protein V8E51_019823 [Hyaloscypha variabilis]
MSPPQNSLSSEDPNLELQTDTMSSSLASSTLVKALLQDLPRIATSFESTPTPTFTLFPKLPRELRNRIWHMEAFESRVIKLVPYNVAASQRVEGQLQHPAMLHTSREARREGLRYYRKVLRKCCDLRTHSQNIPCGKPRDIIYVNFEVDLFRYGIYNRNPIEDGKLAFDWKVVPWGGLNFRIPDVVQIKRLEIELFSSKYPNAVDTFRSLKPLRDNVKFEECTFLLKRWNGPHLLKTFSEDSFRTALYYSDMFKAFGQVFKEGQQRKGLDFAFNVRVRSKEEWYDLPPCAPLRPDT